MKVLFINKFFYLRGGSEKVLFAEAQLLEQKGHEVGFFAMHHPQNVASRFADYFMPAVDYGVRMGLVQKVQETGRILYSWEARKRLRRLLAWEKFDLAHLHNIHHQLSPSILDELERFGVPAVMTLHDYKMVCPTYYLLWRGELCERCAQGRFYHCVLRRCTKGSYAKSFINMVEMYLHHRLMGQYARVSRFISPSRFLQEKLREMGFPGKIVHLSNCINSPDFTPAYGWEEDSLIFFGRLSPEKGLETLIAAVKGLPMTLKLLGEGPQRPELEKKVAAAQINNVQFLGYRQGEALYEEVRKARFVVLPSQLYENNPLSVLEAFALGKPVVGARIGGVPELVRDYETGLTFEPGNIQDLQEKIAFLQAHPGLIQDMGRRARQLVEQKFSPERHYEGLMEIYRRALK